MSINPNSHRPLNIDQEITRLNTIFQEFNTVDKKQKDAKHKQYLLIGAIVLTTFATLHFGNVIAPRLLEERNICNISADPMAKAITIFLGTIFYIGLILFSGFIMGKIYDNLYKDPLIVKYVKNDQQNDHIYLNFSNERKLNRIEYNDLANLKIVINSEVGKALPYDVWNEIYDYYFKKV